MLLTPKELQLLDRIASELFIKERNVSNDIYDHPMVLIEVTKKCYVEAQSFLDGRKQYFKDLKLNGVT